MPPCDLAEQSAQNAAEPVCGALACIPGWLPMSKCHRGIHLEDKVVEGIIHLLHHA